jgi:hypothetical protein
MAETAAVTGYWEPFTSIAANLGAASGTISGRSPSIRTTRTPLLASAGCLPLADGRRREPTASARRCGLNPYHPDWYWDVLGTVLYQTRRYADAAEVLGRVTRPGFWTLCCRAACAAQIGQTGQAAAAAAEARRLRPNCSLAKMRLSKWNADAEHLIEGMRKAGLPE